MQGPGARSLAKLRKEGWRPWVVEKWISQIKQRLDLWNFGDILAVKVQPRDRKAAQPHPPLIVQTTTASNAAARVKKITVDCADAAFDWLLSGGGIVVHGWKKRTINGRPRWECVETIITQEMLHVGESSSVAGSSLDAAVAEEAV